MFTNIWHSLIPRGRPLETVLDLGCGLAPFLDAYAPSRYVGLDIDRSLLNRAARRTGYHQFAAADIDGGAYLPLSAQCARFDLILLVGVVPYLSDDSRLWQQLRGLLNPGGCLFITVTADHRLHRLLDIYQLRRRHRFFRREEFGRLLVEQGFRVCSVAEYGALLLPLLNILYLFVDAIDQLVLGRRGGLGPICMTVRRLLAPFALRELHRPVKRGYQIVAICTLDPQEV
jgi:SAM-dependent methyltransferase